MLSFYLIKEWLRIFDEYVGLKILEKIREKIK